MAIFQNNQESNFETAARNVERSAVEQVAWSRIGEIEMGPFAYYQALVASGVIKRIEDQQYRLSVNKVAIEATQKPVYIDPVEQNITPIAEAYSNADSVSAARQELARISETNEDLGQQPPVDTHEFGLKA